jgi:hypothetical protein
MEPTLRRLIRILVEEDSKEDLDEFSGVGAVAGYTVPLGHPGGAPEENPRVKPLKKKKKKS